MTFYFRDVACRGIHALCAIFSHVDKLFHGVIARSEWFSAHHQRGKLRSIPVFGDRVKRSTSQAIFDGDIDNPNKVSESCNAEHGRVHPTLMLSMVKVGILEEE